MTTHKSSDETKTEVLEWLRQTPYATAILDSVSGGSANFIYRAHLLKPLENGAADVLVKHGEEYMAKYPSNRLTIDRCVSIHSQYSRQ